jgi:DNA polymerase sigma
MWTALGQTASIGRLFLALLKFWGEDFNYETQAISVNPPAIIPKSPSLPVSSTIQLIPSKPRK